MAAFAPARNQGEDETNNIDRLGEEVQKAKDKNCTEKKEGQLPTRFINICFLIEK